MKTLKSKIDLEKAKQLQEICEKLKELTKLEKELKEHFKDKIEDVAKAGDILIIVDTKSRTSLDKKELYQVLGDDLKKYEKTTTYKTLSLKRA